MMEGQEKPLRAAVIGLGSMGANHARVLADTRGIELVGVVDTDPVRIAAATSGRVTRGFATVDELFQAVSPVLVSIVVPTLLHESVALDVISRGASVLVEKPIAATLGEGRRIASAAAARGVIVSVGHIERFNPAIQELKRRLADGQGGRVLQLRARRVGPFPHRIRDVGVIHDLAPHDIDIMRYLLGDDIDWVFADARRHINTDNEDMFAGILRFGSGAMGLLDINWLTPMKERSLSVLCERGMFVVDYAAQSLGFYENFAAVARDGAIASVTEGPMTRYPIANREPLRAEIEAVRDAVASGGPAPVTAHDGLVALAVSEALVRSSESGSTVHVEAIDL
ncbi:MAG: Gfo/Idh/MocA family oxidoreductase [Dehalococcoidia bacterium]|nr:Gfo/Idh/MocA family oxidoreductase [Dehalococcoidia bacterium]MCB9486908.1 Gfo/Idh/MocA family oxidoreductase [Thermoflexaceae bacterium]